MKLTVTFDRRYRPWEASDIPSSTVAFMGVLVDPQGYLVATDGFILACVPCAITGEHDGTDVLVPAWWLKAIAEASTSSNIMFTVQDGKARFAEDERTTTLVKGKAVRWRTTLVDIGKPDTHATIDPRLLTRLAAALGTSSECSLVFTNGPSAALYVAPPGSKALGLLMPMGQGVNLQEVQAGINMMTGWKAPPP